MSTVLCFGEILWDVFPTRRCLGGAPLNVAYHLNHLGISAAILSTVGRDELAEPTLHAVRAAGVPTWGIGRKAEHPTGQATVHLDAAGHARFTLLTPSAWDEISIPASFAEEPRMIVFGTLALRSETNRASLSRLLDRFPDALALCDLNLRPPFDDLPPLHSLIRRASLLKLNDAEANQLTQAGVDVEAQARQLQAFFGVDRICITQGKDGASLLVENRFFHGEAPATTVVDTVGAGDAFTAGLVAGVLEERDSPSWPYVLSLGAALGSFVAGSAGAQPSHAGFRRPLRKPPTLGGV